MIKRVAFLVFLVALFGARISAQEVRVRQVGYFGPFDRDLLTINSHLYFLGEEPITEAQFFRLAGLDPHIPELFSRETRRRVSRAWRRFGVGAALVTASFMIENAFPLALAVPFTVLGAVDAYIASERKSHYLFSYEAITIASLINAGDSEGIHEYWPEFPEERSTVRLRLGYSEKMGRPGSIYSFYR